MGSCIKKMCDCCGPSIPSVGIDGNKVRCCDNDTSSCVCCIFGGEPQKAQPTTTDDSVPASVPVSVPVSSSSENK
jgi:hypothetical protein